MVGEVDYVPCINHSISTPFHTSDSKCMTTKTNNAFPQCSIPYSCITIFTGTYKAATWSTEVYRFPGNTSYPFLVALKQNQV